MTSEPVIDENLYSRQLYVLGVDAMKKLISSSVLISGMGGLGVEIAKNIILAGIKNVTIHDTRNVRMEDLASQFYLDESMIGKNRALACISPLSSLNDYVSVSAKTDELSDSFLKNYNCIVITDHHKESEIRRISQFCHDNKIKLMLCEARGVFAYIFDDFGEDFCVVDNNGEPPSRFLISFISRAKEGIVTIAEDETHDLGDFDHVRFEEVEGMTELNGKDIPVTRIIDARHFAIGDTSNFHEYTCEHKSGYGNQVKQPLVIKFKSLTEAITCDNKPFENIFDFCSFGRDQQVVLAFLASQRYMEKHNTDDTTVSGDDLVAAAKEVNNETHLVDEIDEKLIREFARESPAVISPTCATFGGIAGQEVIKAISGKFTPLNQFLAMGYVEALPEKIVTTLKGDRYDPYRIVFGNEQQEVMQKLRYFMVGAGALGCEQLKNWAMMGVATSGDGKVFVTDMDSIEKSNLNRQFLFRNTDIGKMKSVAAAQAATAMNPQIKIEPHTNRIGTESAAIYNDRFYASLSGVCNALDNVQTRLFSDQMCVFYDRPLLESGTLGPKAHYQIVVPHMTESYGSQPDPPEKGIPMCTLHNFPSCIDHTCMWARDLFGGIFEQQPQSVNSYLNDKDYVAKMQRSDPGVLQTTLQAVKEYLVSEKCETYVDCIAWARRKFEDLFNYKIRDLMNQFPVDCKTSEGLPFWTGAKRFPSPATYDPENTYHQNFIHAAATLRARVNGIKPDGDKTPEWIRAAQVKCPEWVPSNQRISLEDEDNKNSGGVVDDLPLLIDELAPLQNLKVRLTPEEFEKDDDSNGHMEFIAAAANIRAINYQIEPQSLLEIKRIAGKIIPAIATTTAMICGLVALEMYKVHAIVPKKIEDFRFGSINLAIGMFGLSEPVPCASKPCSSNGEKYTLWDKWIFEGDLTLGELIQQAKSKYNVTVDMVTVGSKLLYCSFNQSYQARLAKKITDCLVNDLQQPPLADGQFLIGMNVGCIDDDDNDVETPPFVIKVQ